MKHLKTIVMMIAATMALCACSDEEFTYLPDSHWLLHVDGITEGHRLGLTFSGDDMQVRDAQGNAPFSDGTWQYYITPDNELYMSSSYTDSDGYTQTYSYSFRFSINADQTQMTLVYDPWLGSSRIYTFDRR